MLEELRRKPKMVRQLYAFWNAAGITGLIAVVWSVSLFVKLSDVTPGVTEGKDNTAGAFSQFFNKIDNGASGELWKKLKREDVAAPNTTATTTATTTDSNNVSSSTSSAKKINKSPVMIATTSQQSTKTSTSSADR